MPDLVEKARARLKVARLALSLALTAAWTSASATAMGAELQVSGPPGCVDGQELGFRIERALGAPLRDVAPLQVNVSVTRARARLSARVELLDATATQRTGRAVRGLDCDELTDAIAVVIALALDSSGTPTQVEATGTAELRLATPPQEVPEPSSAAASEAEGVDASGSSAESESSPDPEQPTIVPAVSLWAVGDAGSLPAPGVGLSLGVELGAEYWQVRATGTLLIDQQHQLGSAGAPGAELRLATGALLGCVIPAGAPSSPLQLRACAGWELGQLSGAGTGVAEPRTQSSLWSAPLAELGLLWAVPATRVRLGGLAVLALPLGRDEFVLRDIGPVHRPASMVGRAMLGAAFSLD